MIRALPLLLLAAMLIAGSLAAGPGIDIDLANRFAAASRAHPLGTDHLGRDVAERVLLAWSALTFLGVGADTGRPD